MSPRQHLQFILINISTALVSTMIEQNFVDGIFIIGTFILGIVLLSIVGIAMRCASRYEMNMVR